MSEIYNFTAKTISGSEQALADFRGRALLIVNVASQCGFTPQYEGLQALQEKYADRGFAVLGFPCNQFGRQEPGDEADIDNFCSTRFHVSFPMFAKIDVNGPNAHPLWTYLKKEKTGLMGGAIKWNFTKFLVSPEGQVTDRFPPTMRPAAIEPKIERLLPA